MQALMVAQLISYADILSFYTLFGLNWPLTGPSQQKNILKRETKNLFKKLRAYKSTFSISFLSSKHVGIKTACSSSILDQI
jgi:hypothetical protein